MIKLGLVTAFSGHFGVSGQEALRGAYLALAECDYRVTGNPVKLVTRTTDGTAGSAINAARELLDHEGCDLIIGPLSRDEGIGLRELAKIRHDRVFINGASPSQSIINPAPNFLTFCGSCAQWMAGMGRYAYRNRGWRQVAVIGDKTPDFCTQMGSFNLEFTRMGGNISEMIWCEAGTDNYAPYINRIPNHVDAVLCLLNGPDFIKLSQQLRLLKGHIPMITGPAVADPSVLHFATEEADYLDGVLVASPIVDDNPDHDWVRFVDRYRAAYPHDLYSPSAVACHYYTATTAALVGLKAVECDLSEDRRSLKQALNNLTFQAPQGPVYLDDQQTAIINNYIGEIRVTVDGTLYTDLLHKVTGVNATLGLPRAEYLNMGDFNLGQIPA